MTVSSRKRIFIRECDKLITIPLVARVMWTNCAKWNRIWRWEPMPKVKKLKIIWRILSQFCWIRWVENNSIHKEFAISKSELENWWICLFQSISNYDKIRIIALYCMVKNGISEENLRKLFTHAQIGEKEQDMVRNLSFLGVNTIQDVRMIWFSLNGNWVWTKLIFLSYFLLKFSKNRARRYKSNVWNL